MFAVLPFGNATVIETLTYEQLVAAFVNGFKPPCGDVAGGTGRTPQFAGLKVTVHCTGTVPVIDSIVRLSDNKTLAAGDTIRIVTNDFMYTGGDGYTALHRRHERQADGRSAARRGHRVHHGQLAGGARGRRSADRSIDPDWGPWHDSCRGPRSAGT